ncbi:MAG: GNAT family N-acetyltransferase [Pseudomonadales bacterium]
MNNPESEFIERYALEDMHNAADESDIQSLGLASHTIGAAFVSLASQLPSSAIVINRVLGLGLGTEAAREEINRLVSIYRECNVGRYFVQLHPKHQPAQVKGWLKDEGLRIGRGWQKFSRGSKPIVASKSNLSVREIDQRHGREFGCIVCDAFDLGDKTIPWLAKLPARPDWHIFMSFEDSRPAGVGALYVKDGFGWTDFGATAPAFRCRGSQGALMSARLERALDLGCKKIFTCTGVSVPGDPQHSYSNILKAGFSEEYVRENYELF